MQWSLGLLVRWTAYAALCACGVLMFMGYWIGPELETRKPYHHDLVTLPASAANAKGPGFIDSQGRLVHLQLEDGDLLDYPSLAPWADALGRSQVVGRWSRRRGHGVEALGQEFGLARYSFPEGRTLNRVVTEIPPASPPCWLPGTAAQVVYPGIDGRLYRFNFEADDDPKRSDLHPRRLEWNVPGLSAADVAACELARSLDGALPGILIASLRVRTGPTDPSNMSAPQIWWLKLSPDHTAVEAAGRLTPEPKPTILSLLPQHVPIISRFIDLHDDPPSERFPSVGHDENLELCVAYLTRADRDHAWTLNVIHLPPTLDFSAAPPVASPRQVARQRCAGVAPLFRPYGELFALDATAVLDPARTSKNRPLLFPTAVRHLDNVPPE